MIKRIIADIILLLSVFFLPWYFTLAAAVLFAFVFKSFWEAVVAGLFLDSLNYTQTSGIYGRFGLFTLTAVILIIVMEKIKKIVRV